MTPSAARLGAFICVPVCTFCLACSDGPASPLVAVDSLVYVTPEQAGFSSAALDEVEEFAEQIGSAAVVALHDNRVFFTWGEVDRKYLVHSIRKSLLNSLYGINVDRGAIDTASTLAKLEIDDISPSLSAAEKQACVADLLRSRSGVYHEAAAESQWMKDNRPARGSHPPGTYYYYNNWDFNALGTIFRQETGTSIFYAFKVEIAEPIGMESFIATDGHYYYERELSEHPAYHFRLTAIDLARYGLLYLRRGRWSGVQIVPEGWIAASTQTHSVLNDTLGYGYGMLWFVITDDFPYYGPGFYHTGYGGHMLLVLPEDNLVIVHRVDTDGATRVASADVYQLAAMVVNSRIGPSVGVATKRARDDPGP